MQFIETSVLPILQDLAPPDYLFQQDLASVHNSAYSQNRFKELGVPMLEWASRSPDLNIIENCWSMIANKVYDGPQFNNKQEIWNAIDAAVCDINANNRDSLLKLWDSIPSRNRKKSMKSSAKHRTTKNKVIMTSSSQAISTIKTFKFHQLSSLSLKCERNNNSSIKISSNYVNNLRPNLSNTLLVTGTSLCVILWLMIACMPVVARNTFTWDDLGVSLATQHNGKNLTPRDLKLYVAPAQQRSSKGTSDLSPVSSARSAVDKAVSASASQQQHANYLADPQQSVSFYMQPSSDDVSNSHQQSPTYNGQSSVDSNPTNAHATAQQSQALSALTVSLASLKSRLARQHQQQQQQQQQHQSGGQTSQQQDHHSNQQQTAGQDSYQASAGATGADNKTIVLAIPAKINFLADKQAATGAKQPQDLSPNLADPRPYAADASSSSSSLASSGDSQASAEAPSLPGSYSSYLSQAVDAANANNNDPTSSQYILVNSADQHAYRNSPASSSYSNHHHHYPSSINQYASLTPASQALLSSVGDPTGGYQVAPRYEWSESNEDDYSHVAVPSPMGGPSHLPSSSGQPNLACSALCQSIESARWSISKYKACCSTRIASMYDSDSRTHDSTSDSYPYGRRPRSRTRRDRTRRPHSNSYSSFGIERDEDGVQRDVSTDSGHGRGIKSYDQDSPEPETQSWRGPTGGNKKRTKARKTPVPIEGYIANNPYRHQPEQMTDGHSTLDQSSGDQSSNYPDSHAQHNESPDSETTGHKINSPSSNLESDEIPSLPSRNPDQAGDSGNNDEEYSSYGSYGRDRYANSGSTGSDSDMSHSNRGSASVADSNENDDRNSELSRPITLDVHAVHKRRRANRYATSSNGKKGLKHGPNKSRRRGRKSSQDKSASTKHSNHGSDHHEQSSESGGHESNSADDNNNSSGGSVSSSSSNYNNNTNNNEHSNNGDSKDISGTKKHETKEYGDTGKAHATNELSTLSNLSKTTSHLKELLSLLEKKASANAGEPSSSSLLGTNSYSNASSAGQTQAPQQHQQQQQLQMSTFGWPSTGPSVSGAQDHLVSPYAAADVYKQTFKYDSAPYFMTASHVSNPMLNTDALYAGAGGISYGNLSPYGSISSLNAGLVNSGPIASQQAAALMVARKRRLHSAAATAGANKHYKYRRVPTQYTTTRGHYLSAINPMLSATSGSATGPTKSHHYINSMYYPAVQYPMWYTASRAPQSQSATMGAQMPAIATAGALVSPGERSVSVSMRPKASVYSFASYPPSSAAKIGTGPQPMSGEYSSINDEGTSRSAVSLYEGVSPMSSIMRPTSIRLIAARPKPYIYRPQVLPIYTRHAILAQPVDVK
ncbi:hypothetical protein GZH46_00513 [Fragariocoptes setiger]|uniref:Uncharacterized protein n=1 Tax=Fragariocoptes setiger TaxID=1670756 RepID=A0ABQ7SBY7_9ACAR|nr:hypothetical protein GZH46_00513 [Fragariocoptes setiger]